MQSVWARSSIALYCIVSVHLYSASCSAHQSEALPVRETQREENSLRIRRFYYNELFSRAAEWLQNVTVSYLVCDVYLIFLS